MHLIPGNEVGSPTAMSMEVHHGQVQKGVATGGKTHIPEIPSPAPNYRKRLIFTDQNMEPPDSTIPKIAETSCWSDKAVVLVKGGRG